MFSLTIAGCSLKDESYFYKLAINTVKKHYKLEENVFPDKKECEIYILKNIVRVDIPLKDVNKETKKQIITVWFKNMAHEWQLDRIEKRNNG